MRKFYPVTGYRHYPTKEQLVKWRGATGDDGFPFRLTDGVDANIRLRFSPSPGLGSNGSVVVFHGRAEIDGRVVDCRVFYQAESNSLKEVVIDD